MTTDDAASVRRLQQEWILRWDRRRDEPPSSFPDTFADLYDWSSADVLLQDAFDPEHRTFRTASAYGEAFWPGFLAMQAAEHAIEDAPQVIVQDGLAASRFVFVARLTTADGTVLANRCTTSQVWRRDDDGRWRIVRDHTMVAPMSLADADTALATLPRRPVELEP